MKRIARHILRPPLPRRHPDGMGYLPIEDCAVIGNLRTVALVGINGSIDWFCFPNFDSPSVFAAILDDRKGGRFRIGPVSADGVVCKQMYWPDTNVLIAPFFSAQGVVSRAE